MANISHTILRRIRAKRRGWVFTPKNFIDIANRSAIDRGIVIVFSSTLGWKDVLSTTHCRFKT